MRSEVSGETQAKKNATARQFPVRSPTACLLKWGWSSLYVYTGKTNSCHRTQLSTLAPGDLASFHNTADKLAKRAMMRKGEWPGQGTGCEYCRDIEVAGGLSDRVRNLDLLATDDDHVARIPPELFRDSAALAVTPTMLEVYFNNVCNLACIYCGPEYSTRWIAENRRFGQLDLHRARIDHHAAAILDQSYGERLAEFWDWMDGHAHALRLINVLGGEPFCQPETEQMISFLQDHPNRELHLKIFSNLVIDEGRFAALMSRLRQLHESGSCKSVGIIASLDCWGPAQEYTRWGLDLAIWERNYITLITEHAWAPVSINCTINALSIKAMPELLARFTGWQQMRSEKHPSRLVDDLTIVFNKLCGPPFMDAAIFPEGFFDEDFDRIVGLLPARNDWEAGNIEYMKGIWKSVNSSIFDARLVSRLKNYLDEMDRRHGTDWRRTFAWLEAV
jgi:hypothetical protein